MTRFYSSARSLSLLLCFAAALAACGGDDAPPTSADLGVDSSTADLGAVDAATPEDGATPDDAATPSDAAVPDDAATPDDAGVDVDAGLVVDAGPTPACDPELGAACDPTTGCTGGYECGNGRCIPQARAICGGFVGATCGGPVAGDATACLYYADGSDYGPCFTPAERDCLCAHPASGFVCP